MQYLHRLIRHLPHKHRLSIDLATFPGTCTRGSCARRARGRCRCRVGDCCGSGTTFEGVQPARRPYFGAPSAIECLLEGRGTRRKSSRPIVSVPDVYFIYYRRSAEACNHLFCSIYVYSSPYSHASCCVYLSFSSNVQQPLAIPVKVRRVHILGNILPERCFTSIVYGARIDFSISFTLELLCERKLSCHGIIRFSSLCSVFL